MRVNLKSKKLFIAIGGFTAALILLAGGGAWAHSRRTTPESLLYQALALEAPEQIVASEKINGDDAKASFEAIVSKSGKYQAEGSFECFGSSSLGETQLKVSMRQLKKDVFFQYNEIKFSGGDNEALNQELNDHYKSSVVNKWILMADPDLGAIGYQEKGVDFGLLGAVSKTMSPKEIADKLKEHNVITIESSRETKSGIKPVVEYTLVVRRSAYKKFMESLEPQFKYREEILDQLFTDDTEEITLVINKDDKTIDHVNYTIYNVCGLFIGQFDPEAASLMNATVDVETRNPSKPSAATGKLAKPTNYITQEEFNTLLSE